MSDQPANLATIETDPASAAIAIDAEATDECLGAMWLHGRSAHTIRAYRHDLASLRAFLGGKPLRALTLGDLQAFADTLTCTPNSRSRTLAAVKSLLSFASKLGATPFNVGAAHRKPPTRDTLSDHILEETHVARMLALTEGRNHALLRLAYAGGFRVSELVALRWADCGHAPDGAIYCTVFGKGRQDPDGPHLTGNGARPPRVAGRCP